MPHFDIITNEDGSIAQILRDGVLHDEGVKLEQVHQIVSAYFKIARADLDAMRAAQSDEVKRFYGLQAFLMSLTGVEAFTNVFFHLLAMELNKPDLFARVTDQRGPLVARLRDCIALAFDSPLPGQDALIDRIQQLYRLRNQIVHPRWEPASMMMSGDSPPIIISGLCQNFQANFEDEAFCREAFWWCVKLVAEVGRVRGNAIIEGHCFYWAGIYGLTDEALAQNLGLGDQGELQSA